MRHVVVHYHIFKNAGTTIDAILTRNFGSSHGHIEGKKPWDTLASDSILQFARGGRGLKAISSHCARLPIPSDAHIVFYPLIFLRHPIDRVGFVYAFERKQAENSPDLGVKIALEEDIRGYVKWRLEEGHGSVIKNFQVVHLAGRERDMRIAHATKDDLSIALERLNRLEFFGIVECFQESILKMERYLSNTFGPINTSCRIENRSPDRKETLKERVDELRCELGSALYDEILDKNSLDLELYNRSLELFRTRSTDLFKCMPISK